MQYHEKPKLNASVSVAKVVLAAKMMGNPSPRETAKKDLRMFASVLFDGLGNATLILLSHVSNLLSTVLLLRHGFLLLLESGI